MEMTSSHRRNRAKKLYRIRKTRDAGMTPAASRVAPARASPASSRAGRALGCVARAPRASRAVARAGARDARAARGHGRQLGF
jgi:hypothetical protein